LNLKIALLFYGRLLHFKHVSKVRPERTPLTANCNVFYYFFSASGLGKSAPHFLHLVSLGGLKPLQAGHCVIILFSSGGLKHMEIPLSFLLIFI